MRELGQRRLHLSLRCPHAFAQRNMYRRADTYTAKALSHAEREEIWHFN